jgi:Transglutaminase-like superfamily
MAHGHVAQPARMRDVPLIVKSTTMGAVTPASYFLSKDCFVCNVQGYWVILNAKRDKYHCVTHDDLATVGDHLHGWRRQSMDAKQFPQTTVDGLIDSMIASGIITRDISEGKPFIESEFSICERALETPSRAPSRRFFLYGAARFFTACAKADWHLRHRDLLHILAAIRRRRLRAASRSTVHDGIPTSNLVGTFKHLRPMYPRRYLCLFDSLALAEYLARHCLFPTIVFGVIADPFQAHCWLQEGSVLLNDDLERVRRYKPILHV